MTGYVSGGALLWPFPPDWTNGVNESLAFLSDVMQSGASGIQQVNALRDDPRRTFAFSVGVHDDDRLAVDNFRASIGVRQFLLPIWPDVQWMPATIASGATSISCNTDGFDFVAGGSAVLWNGVEAWEVLTIDSIASDHLALTDAVANDWPIGTRLYPLRKARLQDIPKASFQSDQSMSMDVTALIDEPCDWPAAWPTATTYRSVPVLEWRNEESSDPTDEFDRYGGTVDADAGPVFYFDTPGLPFHQQAQSFQLYGRSDHTSFRSLLYALNGRQSQVWVPSWINDLRLTAAVASDATQIHVPWCGYTQWIAQQRSRRDIAIGLYDGTRLYRRITASSESGAEELLTLDSALGVDVDPSAVRQIGYLGLCSSVSDTFQIAHATDADGVAQSAISWQAGADDV